MRRSSLIPERREAARPESVLLGRAHGFRARAFRASRNDKHKVSIIL
jgi:hypothetical protein